LHSSARFRYVCARGGRRKTINFSPENSIISRLPGIQNLQAAQASSQCFSRKTPYHLLIGSYTHNDRHNSRLRSRKRRFGHSRTHLRPKVIGSALTPPAHRLLRLPLWRRSVAEVHRRGCPQWLSERWLHISQEPRYLHRNTRKCLRAFGKVLRTLEGRERQAGMVFPRSKPRIHSARPRKSHAIDRFGRSLKAAGSSP
jgi:hypothetical protein